QVGASEAYYELVRQRRPMTEIIAEAVRIHAPYTHVPYHERIDDGYVNFVNNDHCLLSARAATQLTRMVPQDCAALPLAQTIWYIPAERQEVLAQLCHAGLMDVQDRALYNRSYTTGHKAFRARATVDLGNALGWDNAHNVVYAGALDVAVGPRWYSTYEMACNVVKIYLEKQAVSAIPYGGASKEELAILANNKEPLSREEAQALERALIRE